ncbi:MAG: lipopolysaccharide biosynthesis protein RfbH [Luteolibacter sp.]|jgi:CDP-6-deoxy-D-xylo-4-hexulose-3-dehydrase|nr:lipopolysaccharide biosynthesis protein RfbH [Luteolibacter sp.]
MTSPESIKAEILRLTREYSRLTHAANRPGNDPDRAPHQSGQTIPYAGRVFNEDEVEAAVSSTLDFWLTLGPEGEAMEKELAAFMGVKHCLLVNSGSSANLVAFSALTTHKLPEHKRIRKGDEVITVAAGFPTTVAPIIQCGAVPVFIDAKVQTGNADCSLLESAYSPDKTKAVMMAHALGNPFELVTVLEFCKKYDLWLIEDNCDALGCTYTLPLDKARELGLDHLIKIAEKGGHPLINIHENQELGTKNQELLLTAPTGAFGDISTQSFYPPHHLTMGEGGSVNIVRKPPLKTYAESFRDWGRDCWCASGKDDTCGKRFMWQLGELPEGYDHKYIYSHLGYNLKPLDTQAAIGRVQLKKLPDFIEARKQNWERLRRGLHGLEDYIEFALPTHARAWLPPTTDSPTTDSPTTDSPTTDSPTTDSPASSFTWDSSGCRSDCSWFGFKITIKETAPFTRTELAQELDRHKIGNRMLFGGNLVRQPAFVQLIHDDPSAFRVISSTSADLCTPSSGLRHPSSSPSPASSLRPPASSSPLPAADRIMNQTMFLGTYPGLTGEQIDLMIKVIRGFLESKI